MARGVSDNFLNVARREQRLGRRAALAAIALAPLAAFLADLADDPAYGPVWSAFLVAVALGLVAGYAWTRQRLARYEDDLRVRWNHWMRQAVDASRLSDVERRVHERDPVPGFLGNLATLLVAALNAVLFALLWIAHPAGPALAWPIVGLDGLLLGALVASSALLTRWARDFVRAAEELVQKGEVAIWGER
jgi:hypothetical protein